MKDCEILNPLALVPLPKMEKREKDDEEEEVVIGTRANVGIVWTLKQ